MPGLIPVTQNQLQNQPQNAPVQQNIAGAQQAQAPQMMWNFDKSAIQHTEQGATQSLLGASWTGANQQQFLVPVYGYMRELVLTLTGASGAKGASSIVAGGADAPWNLFTNINFTDVAGTPIINVPGYTAFLCRLFGGYKVFRPDQSLFGYTPLDGTANGGGGTGNFKFKEELPLEFGTDGLGALPNMDSSAQYRLNLTYASPSVFYNGSSQQPATLPNISALLELRARAKPGTTDRQGIPQAQEPPAKGTICYWSSQTFTVNNGQNTIQLTRVGNVMRAHILIFRDANGSRANADSTGVTPSVIEFDWDAGIFHKVNVDTQRLLNHELYGFDVPEGVIVFPYVTGPNNLQSGEFGNHWLQTLGSTLLKFQFISSAAGTLEVATIDFVPGSNAVFSAPAQSL